MIAVKSNLEDLKKRGWVDKNNIDALKDKTCDELIAMTQSQIAEERTLAVYNLSKFPMNGNLVLELLSILGKEKCLYTKLAICETLEKGNIDAARQMTSFLGKIGVNQHKVLPDKVSKKKSYPLSRDIIARILGNMDESVFPALLEVLRFNDESKISEVIDAIGFMAFYHPGLATLKNATSIYHLIDTYQDNLLILWKAVLCLSAFPLQESIDILKMTRNQFSNIIICEEANRSLLLIRYNRKGI